MNLPRFIPRRGKDAAGNLRLWWRCELCEDEGTVDQKTGTCRGCWRVVELAPAALALAQQKASQP